MRNNPSLMHAAIGPAMAIMLSGCMSNPFVSSKSPLDSPEPMDYNPVAVQAEATAVARSELSSAEPVTPVVPVTPFPEQAGDLWDRVRDGYALEEIRHSRIDAEMAWFARNPDYLARVSQRARPYFYDIVEEVDRRDLPMELALLPVVESGFQPLAYSPGRAAGLWQFIPGTGRRYGLAQNWWYDGRRDVYAATRAALDYLEQLNREFEGDWLLALAGYNAGAGNVRKAIRRNEASGKPTDFWSLNLPRETRGYVPRLLAVARLVDAPGDHDITLTSIPNEPYFARVAIDEQIDLSVAAELAGISTEEMHRLNPGFNRWATAPRGPHFLLLPVDQAAGFRVALNELPADKRMQWDRHRIRSGETLGHIARKHGTTVAVLQEVNGLSGTRIRAGKHLIIPVSGKGRTSAPVIADAARKTGKKQSRKDQKTVHVVRRGDTLWELSRAYGVKVNQLAHWNAMAPRDTLRPGQKLVVWSRAGNQPALLRTPAGANLQRVRYTVRNGDSLARIAGRFNVTVAQLRKWNPATARNRYLQPGQKLNVYVDVTRQTGA